MPQLQVIKREPDPYAELSSNAGANIADTIIKRQAHELAVNQYKLDAKVAASEEEKEASAQKEKFFTSLSKLRERIQSGEIPPKVGAMELRQLFQAHKKGFGDLAEHNQNMQKYEKMLRDTKPDKGTATEAQYRGAQVKNQEASARESDAMATYLADSDMPPGEAAGQLLNNASPGQQAQNTANAVQGGQSQWVKTEMNRTPSGPSSKWVNQGAQDASKYSETMAAERARSDVDKENVVAVYDEYMNDLNDAIGEIGGRASTPLVAAVKGKLSGLYGQVKPNSKIPTINAKRIQTVGQMLSRRINKGATSETDTQIGINIVPTLDHAKATAEALNRTARAAIGASDAGADGKKTLEDAGKLAKEIIKTDKEFTQHLKKKHASITEEEINASLDALHKKRGW